MLHNHYLLPGEIAVDNFSGGGGAGVGVSKAIGKAVSIAINHDPDAIDMYRKNHPNTEVYCESVFEVDPVKLCKGRTVGVAWFSPDCRHFSKASNSTPINKNIRGLAWIKVKWLALVNVRTSYLENVEEFLTWGPVLNSRPDPTRKGEIFEGFYKALTSGLNLSHPAWSDIYNALFKNNYDIKQKLILFKAIKHGLNYKVEYRMLKACDFGVPTTRKRLFLVARKDGLPIVWPDKTHGDETGLKPYRTAAEVIDWSVPTKSIFNRTKPVAEKTLQRIAKGLDKFLLNNPEPFNVPEEFASSFITQHAHSSSPRNHSTNEPLRTICAKVKGGHFAIVDIKLQKFNSGEIATIDKHQTDNSTQVHAFIVKYYGTTYGLPCTEPLHTITTKDRFALVTVLKQQYKIVDIGMRMFQPHELFAAMGFPEGYVIDRLLNGKKRTKAEQVARCGNAVCPPLAYELVRANITVKEPNRVAA